ncbi:MAG TPA: DUF4197 domain-containing protein [Thermoanaerobaculia bacterium]|nr:DUF4197 domain-containing protein [Thermoanaerobaculia bacterium]
MRLKPFSAAGMLFLAAPLVLAQIDVSKIFGGGGKDLSNQDIVSGLKEALTVGTTNTVDLTGKPDGYFGNAAIKILLPKQLDHVEQGLRLLGQGDKVDELVLSMNRAAEKAAPGARDIFWGAIKSMTFDDARKILSGGDTAATDYFRAKTSDALTASFRPVVVDSMKDVGVVQQFKQLQSAYQSVPLASALPSVDIESYVVAKALDGLFYVLGQQEKEIRTNPAAQVTSLLKKVFGK